MASSDTNGGKGERLAVRFLVEEEATVAEECIWCYKNDDGTFTTDNIPFYVRDVSIGDVIAVESRNGELWFNAVVRRSENTTVRIVGMKKISFDEIISKLQSFGGVAERMEGGEFAAVSFPPLADLASAFEFLDRESAAENLGFEESSVRYRSWRD